MNKQKLLLSLVMTIVISSLFVIVSTDDSDASVGDVFTSGNLNYRITMDDSDSCEVEVSGVYNKKASHDIPQSVVRNGKTYYVTGIGDSAFYDTRSDKTLYISSVTIPDTVTYIGDRAFYYCQSLKSITIPDSVKHIGNEVFTVSGLQTVVLSKNIEHIGDFAFGQRLSSINLGDK